MRGSEDLAEAYDRARDATRELRARAEEALNLAQQLEELTKGTPAWYAGTRARVEARATLEQTEELRRVLEELGERLGD